jgi:dihydrolipoamide dehydrogenase
MKNYDLIVIGTGSAMNIASALMNRDPEMKVAVIDKDEPGGICLTRGCIPTKIILYPAELVRIVESAKDLGVYADLKKVDFGKVMGRMRELIGEDISNIRQGLSHSHNLDYYTDIAEFIAPYKLKVGKETITSKFILLCTGSAVTVPPIKGLNKVNYHTSDTILKLNKLPESMVILGGGYIGAEYGHFFAAMGSKVTILGRNPQFLPQEEPEVSELAKKELEKHMKIATNFEVTEVQKTLTGKIKVIAKNRKSGKTVSVTASDIFVATGRGSNSDILKPEKAGIKTDKNGWIVTDEYLETTSPGVWAFGDANGKYLFKHVANYESRIVFYNAVMNRKTKVDYHAIPHAVFTHPEIASVGMGQAEAVKLLGGENVYVGIQKYEDTAKGMAMGITDYFVKVIVNGKNNKILGAHIIGPQASVLIQEIINLMYTKDGSSITMQESMHIHPALSEVVERAFGNLTPVVHKHKHH